MWLKKAVEDEVSFAVLMALMGHGAAETLVQEMRSHKESQTGNGFIKQENWTILQLFI